MHPRVTKSSRAACMLSRFMQRQNAVYILTLFWCLSAAGTSVQASEDAHLPKMVLNHSTSPSGHNSLPHIMLSKATVAASAIQPLSTPHRTSFGNVILRVKSRARLTVPSSSSMSQRMMTVTAVRITGTSQISVPSSQCARARTTGPRANVLGSVRLA
jgi:hypothetical protein